LRRQQRNDSVILFWKYRKERQTVKRILSALLALVLAFGAVVTAAPKAEAVSFSDVKPGSWYYEDVMKLAGYGFINGKGGGRFCPNDQMKRGEFIKLLAVVSEYLPVTPLKGVHWSELYWNALNETGVLEVVEADSKGNQYAYPLIPLDAAELDKNINRYEMAYLINRSVYMVYYENQMQLKDSGDSFANHIGDYDTMTPAYRSSVEQVYSKGILQGYGGSSFQGDNTLTRAEAVTAVVRMIWKDRRVAQDFAVEVDNSAQQPPTFESFAFKYRNMSNAERRQALFGNPNKTYFTSAKDADGYMVSFQIPIWKLNEKTGQKTSSKAWITVHKLVEKEVRAIFDEIYNSPERFPINAVGGSRYTDSMRHSWGCAIDINPNENYYINYRTGQTVGSFCWKNGSSPYCITPESSVVKAFAKYGWGWGGQGWSTSADYMHFSILASGG